MAHSPTATVTQSQTFVTTATQANLAEISAAQLAMQMSSSSRVQAFAKQMINDHSSLGNMLTRVAQSENLNSPSSPSNLESAQIAQLRKLNGRAFNAAYASQQVAAHRAAVALFTNEANAGTDVQLRQFAANALPTMRHHLTMAVALENAYPGGSQMMTNSGGGNMGTMSQTNGEMQVQSGGGPRGGNLGGPSTQGSGGQGAAGNPNGNTSGAGGYVNGGSGNPPTISVTPGSDAAPTSKPSGTP